MLCMPVYWLMGVEKNRPVFSFFLPFPRLAVSLDVETLLFLKLLGLGGTVIGARRCAPPHSRAWPCGRGRAWPCGCCCPPPAAARPLPGAGARCGRGSSRAEERQEVLALGRDWPCPAIRESGPLSKDLRVLCSPRPFGTRSVMHVI